MNAFVFANVGGVVARQVTVARLLQPLKAEAPMEVTPAGRVICVRPVQPWKTEAPMEVTPAGRVICVRPVQP